MSYEGTKAKLWSEGGLRPHLKYEIGSIKSEIVVITSYNTTTDTSQLVMSEPNAVVVNRT